MAAVEVRNERNGFADNKARRAAGVNQFAGQLMA
jgi:hypothetical protein